jgi:hypothetical protein
MEIIWIKIGFYVFQKTDENRQVISPEELDDVDFQKTSNVNVLNFNGCDEWARIFK